MFPGQCGNTAFFFKSQPDQFHFEFRGIVFPGKSFFSAHEVSTCKISGCLSYRILDSGPDGTQTTLTQNHISANNIPAIPSSRFLTFSQPGITCPITRREDRICLRAWGQSNQRHQIPIFGWKHESILDEINQIDNDDLLYVNLCIYSSLNIKTMDEVSLEVRGF